MNTKFVPSFKSDVLFKYALSHDKDKDSLFLLHLIIDNLAHISYQSLKVRNPDIIPEKILDKEIILDILLEDNQGRLIDIEMQRSSLSTYLYQRFQFYGARLLVDQLGEGESYDQLHPLYQMIFIDDINTAHPCLQEIYTSRSDTGQQEECNLIHRIYIFLPYINEIKKTKPLEKFTSFEKMIYIFANSIDGDIIEIEDEVVKVMERKLRAFTKEEALAHYATQRYLGRWQNHMEKEDAKKKAMEEGLKEGREIGIELGREEGRLVETREKLIRLLKTKYPHSSLSWIQECSYQQLDKLYDHIFDDIAHDELKKLILK